MTVSRRSLMIGAAALPLVATIRHAGAQTPEFNYKYANFVTAEHPINVRAREAADAIREETGGRVAIQIFPNSQLGGDTDMLSQVRSGGVEFLSLSALILSTLVSNSSISGIGFAFADYDAVWKAMDGELGAYVRKEIEKSNLVVMDKIWDNGFRQITSSRGPINSAEDLKSFKIRVPVSPLWTSMFSAFESAPTSINFAEVYSALQTGIVDGQENPLAIISTAKLYEVQKYCSLTNHMWDGYWFLGNKRAWEAMPEDVRAIVARHLNEAGLKERDDVAKLNASVRDELVAKGVEINQPDSASFREKLKAAGFYTEWKGRFGDEAWAILERSAGVDFS